VQSGIDDSWRWRMESSAGSEQHRRYWLSMIEWLAESRKPRLEAPLQGQIRSLNSPASLDVRLLDNAFRPRSDARVRASIQGPDGIQREQTLQPRFGEPGAFEGKAELSLPGEYQVRYEATFTNGETIQRDIFFIASPEDASGETALNESLLRDIAR